MEVYKMDEFQKNNIINTITRAVLDAVFNVVKNEVKNQIHKNPVLNEIFRQRG